MGFRNLWSRQPVLVVGGVLAAVVVVMHVATALLSVDPVAMTLGELLAGVIAGIVLWHSVYSPATHRRRLIENEAEVIDQLAEGRS